MLRHRRFLLTTLHRLALMGALLMAVAPVISRWVQSQAVVEAPAWTQVVQAMCHGRAMPTGGLAANEHAGHTMATGMPMAMDHGDGMPMPQGHEAACDYCVLAANLLPFVLVLLLLPLLQPAIGRSRLVLAPRRAGALWPAHAARGPPLYS
jgi:hypothetical protein